MIREIEIGAFRRGANRAQGDIDVRKYRIERSFVRAHLVSRNFALFRKIVWIDGANVPVRSQRYVREHGSCARPAIVLRGPRYERATVDLAGSGQAPNANSIAALEAIEHTTAYVNTEARTARMALDAVGSTPTAVRAREACGGYHALPPATWTYHFGPRLEPIVTSDTSFAPCVPRPAAGLPRAISARPSTRGIDARTAIHCAQAAESLPRAQGDSRVTALVSELTRVQAVFALSSGVDRKALRRAMRALRHSLDLALAVPRGRSVSHDSRARA